MKVVVILPTYNERENISSLLSTIEAVFKQMKLHGLTPVVSSPPSVERNPPKQKTGIHPQPNDHDLLRRRIKGHQMAILVVDDNSPDGTAEEVKKAMEKWDNIKMIKGEKRGLGSAYVRGIDYAIKELGADVFFEMDADLSHDPELIPTFLEKIDKGADFVIGSRYIKGGSIPSDWKFYRKIFSLVGNLIVRFGLLIPKIYDWTSGYRAVKAQVFLKVKDGLKKFQGYAFQVAFLHRVEREGFKIEEIPLRFVDRRHGHSKIAPFDYIKNVLIYIFNHSTFIKYCLVGFLGFSVNALGLEVFYRFGISPGLAAALGAEFAILTTFSFNNIWTFKEKKFRKISDTISKFFQFNLTSFGAVVIIGLTVGVGTFIFGEKTRMIFFALSAIFLVIPYNFYMYNRFIWKTHER